MIIVLGVARDDLRPRSALISIPDEFFPYAGRGIGIWIASLRRVALIVAGLLRASEEL